MDGAVAEVAARGRAGARASKSAAAFRTISEVADELDVAQHVLRFWESKFPQVRPLKRGGGRRYYRPEDVELLRQIRSLLYDEGYTIKGAQKLLKGARRGAAGEDDGVEERVEPAVAAKPAPAVDPVRAVGAELPPTVRAYLRHLRDELLELRQALDRALD
jgi:DNA-binding transcriptional MerR regulator